MAYQEILRWKHKKSRKPLILKGARQVGKTFLIIQFGKKEFQKMHVFNFQKDPKIHSLFQETKDPKKIIRLLSDYSGSPINVKTDFIFFDEIQDCPEALTSLKFFSEDMPECYLIAAGSLLGLFLKESSFPVGKVEFIELYPLNYQEFLLAKGKQHLITYLENYKDGIPTAMHELLIEELKSYFIVGGVPEVVKTYLKTLDLKKTRQKQLEILTTYKADFSKYSGPTNAVHILSVFESIPAQLAKDNKKFSFKTLESGGRYSKYRLAIDWLVGAGLAFKIPIIDHIELPLKAFVKDAAFKLYFFDVGILGALSELPTNVFVLTDNEVFKTFKGAFAENFFLQEFVSNNDSSLYCWQGAQSEVEFVFYNEEGLFPIEVKSGLSGKLKSLNIFAEKYKATVRIRANMQNFTEDSKTKFRNIPLYLAGR